MLCTGVDLNVFPQMCGLTVVSTQHELHCYENQCCN